METAAYDYIAVVQCHIVKQRCSGYHCEKAFHERAGGFADIPADKPVRVIYLDCGGCCGRALLRKLANLVKLARKDGIDKSRILVQLSSCITKDNYHAPPCPHLDYLRQLVARSGMDCREDTYISKTSERRRKDGAWQRETET